jgi:hypothetical protein
VFSDGNRIPLVPKELCIESGSVTIERRHARDQIGRLPALAGGLKPR